MSKYWISKVAFEQALKRLQDSSVHVAMPSIIALKALGINTKNFITVKSVEDFQNGFINPFFQIQNEKTGLKGIFKPFVGEIAYKGNYGHGSLFTPLREQRKDVGKKALIWERDTLGLPANDTTNYNLKFTEQYVTVIKEYWLKKGLIPLDALSIYLQSMNGETTEQLSINQLIDNWKITLKLEKEEIIHWFDVSETILDPMVTGIENEFDPRRYLVEHYQDTIADEPSTSEYGLNLIIAGPPGGGKSTLVDKIVGENRKIRCVFHPESSKSDFIGTIRPILLINKDGTKSTVFDFIPGPFAEALLLALSAPAEKIFLIIEELNRADAAAVFGDLFQILDRNEAGESRFPIRMPLDLDGFLRTSLKTSSPAQLYLPRNLHIIGTINTSDESLKPLDSAFRRRWEWTDLDPMNNAPVLNGVQIEGDMSLDWISFVQNLNDRILVCRPGEDCRIGVFYLLPTSNIIKKSDIKSKLLPFLWHDIHRYSVQPLFRGQIISLPSAQLAFDNDGLSAIFDWVPSIEEKLIDTSE